MSGNTHVGQTATLMLNPQREMRRRSENRRECHQTTVLSRPQEEEAVLDRFSRTFCWPGKRKTHRVLCQINCPHGTFYGPLEEVDSFC